MLNRANLKYEINKRAEKALTAVVWRLPRRIIYWSAIRLMAHATVGPYSNQIVPELYAVDALKRWDR